MQIQQRLHRSGVAVTPDRTIADVAKLMEASGIGIVAVLEGDQLTGVATDRDLVRRGIARGYGPDARIDSVMSAPVHTIDADVDLRNAYEEFRKHAVRRLIVVDHGRFVGILSLDDLFLDLAAELVSLTIPLASEALYPQRDGRVPARQ
jgi:CBS domain-containing protein